MRSSCTTANNNENCEILIHYTLSQSSTWWYHWPAPNQYWEVSSAQMEMSWPADATGDRRVCRLPTEMAAGALTMWPTKTGEWEERSSYPILSLNQHITYSLKLPSLTLLFGMLSTFTTETDIVKFDTGKKIPVDFRKKPLILCCGYKVPMFKNATYISPSKFKLHLSFIQCWNWWSLCLQRGWTDSLISPTNWLH